MEELNEILNNKLQIYKSLYIVADEMGQIENCKYYGKCINKLNKMIKIL